MRSTEVGLPSRMTVTVFVSGSTFSTRSWMRVERFDSLRVRVEVSSWSALSLSRMPVTAPEAAPEFQRKSMRMPRLKRWQAKLPGSKLNRYLVVEPIWVALVMLVMVQSLYESFCDRYQ